MILEDAPVIAYGSGLACGGDRDLDPPPCVIPEGRDLPFLVHDAEVSQGQPGLDLLGDQEGGPLIPPHLLRPSSSLVVDQDPPDARPLRAFPYLYPIFNLLFPPS